MDKNTLSNYGWIVIAVLVLSVMIALATPFGTYIENGVKNTTSGFISTNNKTLSVICAHTETMQQNQTDTYTGQTICKHCNTIIDNGYYFHSDTVKENGTYYCETSAANDFEISSAKNQLVEGSTFPNAIKNGDAYVYGDYIYRYTTAYPDGWMVYVRDTSKTTYEEPLTTINGLNVTMMRNTYMNCRNLTTAPNIPRTVTELFWTFQNCESLVNIDNIVLNNNVKNMGGAFYGCTSLTTSPKLPSSITSLSYAFARTSITNFPDISHLDKLTDMTYAFTQCKNTYGEITIPKNVTNISGSFFNCVKMSGNIVINADIKEYKDCFNSVDFLQQNITLSGDCAIIDEIGKTGINYCTSCNGKCDNNH